MLKRTAFRCQAIQGLSPARAVPCSLTVICLRTWSSLCFRWHFSCFKCVCCGTSGTYFCPPGMHEVVWQVCSAASVNSSQIASETDQRLKINSIQISICPSYSSDFFRLREVSGSKSRSRCPVSAKKLKLRIWLRQIREHRLGTLVSLGHFVTYFNLFQIYVHSHTYHAQPLSI